MRSLCANRFRVRSEIAPIGAQGGVERDLGGSRQPDIKSQQHLDLGDVLALESRMLSRREPRVRDYSYGIVMR